MTVVGHGLNVVPTMVDDTHPSGVASASSEAITGAWEAFNHTHGTSSSDRWVINAASGWLQYQFAAAKIITGYCIWSQAYTGDGPWPPMTWTFKGSNDGSTWDTLDTRSNITWWNLIQNAPYQAAFANTTAYTHYRLDISAGNSGSYISVAELELFENCDYSDDQVPAMTSDTAPSGVASASSEAVTPAWRAFDDTVTTDSGDRWVITTTSGWLQYQFAAAVEIIRYTLTTQGYADGPWAPKSWTLKGSNDGTNWTTVDTRALIGQWYSLHSEKLEFVCNGTTGSYAYYRLDVTASNAAYISVGQMEMMKSAAAPPAGRIMSGCNRIW